MRRHDQHVDRVAGDEAAGDRRSGTWKVREHLAEIELLPLRRELVREITSVAPSASR